MEIPLGRSCTLSFCRKGLWCVASPRLSRWFPESSPEYIVCLDWCRYPSDCSRTVKWIDHSIDWPAPGSCRKWGSRLKSAHSFSLRNNWGRSWHPVSRSNQQSWTNSWLSSRRQLRTRCHSETICIGTPPLPPPSYSCSYLPSWQTKNTSFLPWQSRPSPCAPWSVSNWGQSSFRHISHPSTKILWSTPIPETMESFGWKRWILHSRWEVWQLRCLRLFGIVDAIW